LPLSGLKVADFTWLGVGPMTTRYLADFGATVVKVESTTHPDTLRLAAPFRNNEPGINRSGFGAAFNPNKLSMTLNLALPEALDVARRLIRWADVVAESMTPGVMRKLGLGWEEVREINPGAIMFSSSQMGQTGPYARYSGLGAQASSMQGIFGLTGWPDREPAGMNNSYADTIAPWLLLVPLIAALDERRHTGLGCYLDESQYEAGLTFIGPTLLDYAVNGRVPQRMGNDDPVACPHGVFPCAGDQRWLALSVRDDAEWRALCEVLGRSDWLCDDDLARALRRRARKDELDEGIAAWTRERTPEQAMVELQAAGVPAGVVKTAEDLFADPQLRHRGHFWFLDHEVIGRHAYSAPAPKLSRTPAEGQRAAPAIGAHNVLVYREILGYTDEEIADLAVQGVMD
jgi:benzylsuccinate CoA-transferase BbsF subunit